MGSYVCTGPQTRVRTLTVASRSATGLAGWVQGIPLTCQGREGILQRVVFETPGHGLSRACKKEFLSVELSTQSLNNFSAYKKVSWEENVVGEERSR